MSDGATRYDQPDEYVSVPFNMTPEDAMDLAIRFTAECGEPIWCSGYIIEIPVNLIGRWNDFVKEYSTTKWYLSKRDEGGGK